MLLYQFLEKITSGRRCILTLLQRRIWRIFRANLFVYKFWSQNHHFSNIPVYGWQEDIHEEEKGTDEEGFL